MEENLRNEIRSIYMKKREKEITNEEYDEEIKTLIYTLLEKDPQRLIRLCEGHIIGLNEPSLLLLARNKPNDFAYMNISAGAYRYSDVAKGGGDNPDSRKIKKIFSSLLSHLSLSKEEIAEILKKTKNYDEYDDEPAYTILDLLEDEHILASLDWKFALEDVEYNLNLITERLNLTPIKEYPPYEEGEPLGYDALEQIIKECEHSAVILFDGDTLNVFLTSKDKADRVAEELYRLGEFWDLTDIGIID